MFLSNASCWSAAQIWGWCLEGSFYSPNSHIECCQSSFGEWPQFSVRFCLSALPMHMDANFTFSSYWQVLTFGRDTIRKFTANSSEMKKMAAQDFEDLLQVWCLSQRESSDLIVSHSVLSLFLMAFFLNHSINRSYNSSSCLLASMDLQNCGCIPILP